MSRPCRLAHWALPGTVAQPYTLSLTLTSPKKPFTWHRGHKGEQQVADEQHRDAREQHVVTSPAGVQERGAGACASDTSRAGRHLVIGEAGHGILVAKSQSSAPSIPYTPGLWSCLMLRKNVQCATVRCTALHCTPFGLGGGAHHSAGTWPPRRRGRRPARTAHWPWPGGHRGWPAPPQAPS